MSDSSENEQELGNTNDSIITIPKDKILTITNASKEMNKSYTHMAVNYDKIDVPKKDDDLYKKQLMSDADNAKINEIFDEIGETDDIQQAITAFKKKTLH